MKKEPTEIQLLRDFKEESDWSYPQLASSIGVDPMTVYRWFAGKQVPSAIARKLIRRFILDFEPKKRL